MKWEIDWKRDIGYAFAGEGSNFPKSINGLGLVDEVAELRLGIKYHCLVNTLHTKNGINYIA